MVVGIVLAGRPNRGALRAAAPDADWEALIPLGGRPMASYVIAAVAGAREVQRVVVAGPDGLSAAGSMTVAPGDTLSDSLRNALRGLGAAGSVADELVIAAGDAPLLEAATVSELITHARRRALAFAYPIITRAVCDARFPGVRRTYVRIREGVYTGGNCFYLSTEAAPRVLELLEQLHAHRKHPLRLAGMFGWGAVLGLVTGTARLEHLEAAATRLLGRPAGAWVCPDAGAGVDVDDPGDLEVCRVALSGTL